MMARFGLGEAKILRMQHWYAIANVGEIESPALLFYPARIEENIRRMVRMAGGTERLRPHIKTHKTRELVEMQLRRGIGKFKCATLAEAVMAAQAGAPDLLLAYPLVGPNIARWIQLVRAFPATRFSCVADDADALRQLSQAAVQPGAELDVLLDLDCGMHRTGIVPGEDALDLYRTIASLPGLRPGGIHAYDGHLHQSDPGERSARCEEAFVSIGEFREALARENLSVPRMIAGGTPTFPFHARRSEVECSPGTCLLWDQGYTTKLPDLDFLPAALVLTRVISKPGENRLCLDLGHKAIAAENPPPRVYFPDLPDARAVAHSEEHLVLATARAAEIPVGAPLYGIPWHICPTVALHAEAVVIENGAATKHWKIAARDRTVEI
jgi:D-threonine aldolase